MKTTIKSPDFLSFLTTVPQCADNQFVSRKFFSQIAGHTTLKEILEGLLKKKTDHLLESYQQTTQVEYKRSLLFSRQVVLNRNAFWNNPLLISSVLGSDRSGLITLLAENSIVPFLFDETSFEQEPKFDILSLGREAVESLTKDPSLSEIVCVRLGGDDAEENKKARDDFTEDFRNQLDFLNRDNVRERSQKIATTLLGEEGHYPAPTDERVNALAVRLESLAGWVRENKPSRNTLYQNFVTLPDTPPSDGLYRTDPLTFEMKLWMDLIYNSNLPKHLDVLTFVPSGFPTPLDVGLIWTVKKKVALAIEGGGVLEDIAERAKTQATWKAWDTIQKQKNAGLSIPSPADLTHIDVVEIRSWDEWKNMMKEMEIYLEAPLNETGTKNFYTSYDGFLKRLSLWWLGKNENSRRDWASGVAKLYRLGRWFVGLLVVANQVFPILPPSGVDLPPLPDDKDVKVIVENGLYLFDRAQTDWRRTQIIRNVKREQNINRDELNRVWQSIRKLYGELPNNYPGHDMSGKIATEEG